MDSSNVVYRASTLEDREGVAAIGDPYGGVDYMGYMFEKFVTSPNYRSFVCQVGGRIAAFRFYRVVEEGRAIIGGGLRTHPDFRGRNLAKGLGEYAAQEVSKTFPRIFESYLMTAIDNDFNMERIRSNPKEYSLISRRKLKNVRTATAEIKGFLQRHQFSTDIKHPEKIDFLSQLLREPTSTSIFPDNFCIVGWEPFRVTERNLSDVFDERRVEWTLGPGGSPVWLSIFEAYLVPAGLRLDIDMYGHRVECMTDHIARGLEYARQTHPEFEGSVDVLIYTEMAHDLQGFLPSLPYSYGALFGVESAQLCMRRRLFV